jgi:pimeloyl-ACP methyl ester carboxylesterase
MHFAWKRSAIAVFFAATVSMIWAESRAEGVNVSLPPFYAAVARLKPSGKLGTIVARERVATDLPKAEAWRIAYVSSDLQKRKTISTALVIAPKGPPPKGGRPIVAWALGTTGTAENCGPSQAINPAQKLNQYFLIGGNSWLDYGVPAIETWLRQGYVAVATDYQGLGGGGAHQYAVAAVQGRDVINSVRAVVAMGLTGGNRRAVVYGWSQGGGGAIAAASAKDYINEKGTVFDAVEFVGFVGLAPDDVAAAAPQGQFDATAAQAYFAGVVEQFSDNVFNFAHLAMTLWAQPQAFPDLKLTDLFSDEGARAIDEIMRGKCVHVVADTLSYNYSSNFRSLLKDKFDNTEAWTKALIAGAVAPVKPVAPVIAYWGTKDTAVPPVMSKLYREQMCKLGGNVGRVQLAGEQTHFSTPGAAEPLYTAWIIDRLQGKPAPDGCGASSN